MTYGKLFKKYMSTYNVNELSANCCKDLSRKELISMCKNMFGNSKCREVIPSRYITIPTPELKVFVFNALKKL